MFKNYLKTAFRNLRRNKSYALINVVGLAIGMAASLLIFLVIGFETSFDNFHPQKSHIYRINSENYTQDGMNQTPGTPFPVGPGLRADFPQIKKVARIFKGGGELITIDEGGEKKKFKSDLFEVEPEFFEMFHFNWLAGDPKTALSQINSAALTKKTAEKFFGDWH